jgi:hypothetical protein
VVVQVEMTGIANVGYAKEKPTIVLLICTCFAAACIPIPAKHQEQVTPAVVGSLRLADGAPAGDYFIAATDDEKDHTCSRPGGRGVSDSLGRFRLPATSEEQKVFWFTLMENFGWREYWVCAEPSALGAPGGARVASPARTFVFGHFRGDSLDCLQWSWRDTTRLSCNAEGNDKQFPHGANQILRGGSWTEGDVAGSYRVLLVQVGSWVDVRAVVQWVGGAPGTANTVRAQMDLPTRDSVKIFQASLDHVGDAWRVRVNSTRRTRWGNDIWLTYELGPPGQIRELRDK